MPKNNSKTRKAQRQGVAEANQQDRATRTSEQQIDRINAAGHRAKKERLRLSNPHDKKNHG